MPILWRLEGIKRMIKPRFYLSGAMTGVDKNVSANWRRQLVALFKEASCFNPWDFWDMDSSINDREAMNFDINALRKCDLVIVNFELNPLSIGTNMEIAIAYEHRIPIIGYCRHGELHPWQRDMCERVFTDWDEMIDYIRLYYLEEW